MHKGAQVAQSRICQKPLKPTLLLLGLLAVFSRKVLYVPNFCPECGSSEATSRFCSSCGYSLASTPAPPDARTRVEETPVFQSFAPPVVETWDSLAADPWRSSTGVVPPPPVRNVVTQTQVTVSETKLTAVKWLWRVNLLATAAYGVAVANSSDALYIFGLLGIVALLTVTGVAASAARQVGARTPHPALAVLLVIGAAVTSGVLGWLISPESWADVEIASLYDKGLDRRILYGVALLIQSLAVYVAALAPVVALSKALGDRYVGDAPSASLYDWGAVVETEPEGFRWKHAMYCVSVIGIHDVVVTGLMFGVPGADGSLPGGKALLLVFAGPLFLWRNLDFKKLSEIEADRTTAHAKRAKQQAKFVDTPFFSRGYKIVLGLILTLFVVLWIVGYLLSNAQ